MSDSFPKKHYVPQLDIVDLYYRAIVDSSEDAIISKDLSGIITSWNVASEQIFGWTADEAVGQHITLIIPKYLHHEEDMIIGKIRKGEPIKHYETIRQRKDGTLIDISVSVSPIKNNEGRIIGASKIARDITEQKQLSKQRDEFISIATHELKTPVTSIKAYTQVLKNIFAKRNDIKAVEYLGKMDAQLNKLTNLISDLLDVNKIKAGHLQFHQEHFNFDELVTEITEELQRTTSRHVLELRLGKVPDIDGDRDRLGQVITNLLSNAIKYSPHSDRIIITTQNDNDTVYLSVQDFGIGIPRDKQAKVFEKFFRVSGPKQDTFPGLGLGLFISAQIVERLGGRIWVESETGQGSTFHLSLPINVTEQGEGNQRLQ